MSNVKSKLWLPFCPQNNGRVRRVSTSTHSVQHLHRLQRKLNICVMLAFENMTVKETESKHCRKVMQLPS